MSNSLSPVQRLTTLGGDAINLATSASARSCKRRGLHLRAQLKSQEKR
jgi:hypothetical protein